MGLILPDAHQIGHGKAPAEDLLGHAGADAVDHGGAHGGGAGDQGRVIYLDLQQVPQRDDQLRQGQQKAQLHQAAPEAEIALSPEIQRHHQDDQPRHDQTGDVVVYKVQKRVLAAYGQEQGLGEKGDGVPQGEKRQREKQGGEHRAV